MTSLGMFKKIINIFRCISKGENDLQYLRNSLIQVNKMHFNIYQIYGIISDCNVVDENTKRNIEKGIYKENIIFFLDRCAQGRNDTYKEEGLVEKFIYLNSPNGNSLDINDLNRILTGEEIEKGYVCTYIREELIDEIQYGVVEILLNEIDLVKSLSCLIEESMNCNINNEGININDIYNNISERNGIVTAKSFQMFFKKYFCDDISNDEISYIIKKLSQFKSDSQLTFKDFNRLMSLNKYHNNQHTKHTETVIKNKTIEELEQMLKIYFIDLALTERKIHNAKESFLYHHNDFSVTRLFNFLNLENNNLFSINNSFLQLSFSKLGIYLKGNDLIFLLKRIEHFYKGNKTYNKLFILLMPITQQYVEHDIDDKNSFLLDSTKIALKELVELIVQEERKINILKKEMMKYFNHWYLEQIFNKMLTSENAKENYLNFWNFCNYATYNDIMGNNKNNFTQLDMELLFRRLNKSNNNKLTLYELSNELEWLN